MGLKTSYYKNVFISLKRGGYNGVLSNAKPLFYLAIFKGIEEGWIMGNRIKYDKHLEQVYLKFYEVYDSQSKPAPLFKPFYHSTGESFYSIHWKGFEMPEHKWHTPSAKYLRDHCEYAYFDDGLWELLQEPESREELRNTIINHYLR